MPCHKARYICCLKKATLLILFFFIAQLNALSDRSILFERTKKSFSESVDIFESMKFCRSLNEDGFWNDFLYFKKGYCPIEHLKRVKVLALGFVQSTDRSQKDSLKNGVLRTLEFWLKNEKEFVSDNWWMNEIGVQREIFPIAFLMWHEFPEILKSRIISIFPENPTRNGVNRTWISESVVARGLLEERDSLVRLGLENIESSIHETGREGHRADHSYFMHGNLLYNGGYGKMALSIVAKWAGICQGTEYAFERKTLDAMSALALEGNRWMMWRGMIDPMTMGREISRKGGNKIASSYRTIIENLMKSDPLHFDEYNAWLQEILGKNFLSGCRYFIQGELMICRSDDYYVSLKMSSKSTVGSEMLNRENRKGFWLGSGVLSIYRHPEDFKNIYPLWNWGMLPGITSYNKSEQKEKRVTNRAQFVGGIADGMVGIATMELERSGLKGKKSWFFNKNKIIALGCDIHSLLNEEISTSVDQRLLKTDVQMEEYQNITDNVLYKVKKFCHDDICYAGMDEQFFYLKTEAKVGDWKDIGTLHQKESASVLTIWLPHGVKPNGASYAYLIQLDVGENSSIDSSFYVIENTPASQIVHIDENRIGGVLYRANAVAIDGLEFIFSEACVFLVWQNEKNIKLLVADPSKKLQNLQVLVRKNGFKLYEGNVLFPQKEFLGKFVEVWI